MNFNLCPSCHAENEERAWRCLRCGTSLDAGRPATARELADTEPAAFIATEPGALPPPNRAAPPAVRGARAGTAAPASNGAGPSAPRGGAIGAGEAAAQPFFLPPEAGALWLDDIVDPATAPPVSLTLRDLGAPGAAPPPARDERAAAPARPVAAAASSTVERAGAALAGRQVREAQRAADGPTARPYPASYPASYPAAYPAAQSATLPVLEDALQAPAPPTRSAGTARPAVTTTAGAAPPRMSKAAPTAAPGARAPADAPGSQAQPQPEQAAVHAKRDARRAAVRRSRLRALAQTQEAPPAPVVPVVLVIDADGTARGLLCSLLQAFGFATHAVADPVQGAELARSLPFVAVFADVPPDARDGGGGIAFVRAVQALAPRPLLVLASSPLSSVDRVRADLLGFDAVLDKPLARGPVAGVFDSHGIVLPVDPRRGD